MSTSPRQAAAKRATARPTARPAKPAIQPAPKPEPKPAKSAKPAAKLAAKPAAKPATPDAPPTARAPKEKLVRDGFTFPQAEYAALAAMKKRALTLGGEPKKSEIVRAALARLAAAPDAEFMAALAAVPRIKTGRKKKEKTA